jgi:hypothetical protein
MIRRLSMLLTLAAVAAIGLTSQATAASTCPSFHVLHNDKIGTVKIAAGQYTVAPKGVTCKNSSILIARFLNDWDGILPDGWKIAGGSTIKFTKAGTSESISLKLGYSPSGGGGGGSNITNGACPGDFTVLHNDKIGALKLKAGQYKITTTGLLCWFDASKLAYFLDYNESGKLPSPWTVVPSAMKIQRSPNHYYTLKYLGNSGGGGHSIAGLTRCSKKLSVTTPGLLAGMEFPGGSYYVNVQAGTTCAGAGTLFNKWLVNGAVDNDWKVNSQTATFTLNSKKFQIEAAF